MAFLNAPRGFYRIKEFSSRCLRWQRKQQRISTTSVINATRIRAYPEWLAACLDTLFFLFLFVYRLEQELKLINTAPPPIWQKFLLLFDILSDNIFSSKNSEFGNQHSSCRQRYPQIRIPWAQNSLGMILRRVFPKGEEICVLLLWRKIFRPSSHFAPCGIFSWRISR